MNKARQHRTKGKYPRISDFGLSVAEDDSLGCRLPQKNQATNAVPRSFIRLVEVCL